jgi:GTP:adenosylcobinamide-phosphate guanylyltransferase
MIILLRGDICRGCSIDIQTRAYESIITHVIKPLNLKCNDINVIIVTYTNEYEKIAKDIFKDYNFFYFIINRKGQVENYINALNKIPEFLINETNNLLILRSDLYFKQDIDYSRISKDKILTQWNLLHQKSTGEIADQIQFIGANLIHDFINKINTIKIDTKWEGSLHNFYNYVILYFGKEKISYLNYIKDPTPNNDRCEIRGNPRGRFKPHSSYKNELGNPLFNYTRYET